VRSKLRHVALISAPALLVACAQKDDVSHSTKPFDAIGADEVITLSGTEPFWSISIDGDNATYTSPENLDGSSFTVARFAGNSGLGFTGELDGAPVTIAVTQGQCSDGMSDRTYPFTATVEWGELKLEGCGHTDAQPFTGDETP
jgi:uncharacterized membrane protein